MNKNRLIVILKVLVSLLLVYIIVTNIEVSRLIQEIDNINFFYLVLAFIALNISVFFSAIRNNCFFAMIDKPLDNMFNILLYYKGMFFNIVLPGGISGDLYKGLILKKKLSFNLPEIIKTFLADRVNGLYALVLLFIILAYTSSSFKVYSQEIIIAFILISCLIYFFNKNFFKKFHSQFLKLLIISFLIQSLQIVTIVFILSSLSIDVTAYINIIIIFLFSSIVSIIPITIGGIGSREATFLYFSNFMNLNIEISILIALLFYCTLVLTSLIGITPIKNYKLAVS